MFGAPHIPTNKDLIFYLVWTYTIKALDGRKKAWCVCDDSSRAGHVCILDEVYANCVDQTGSRLFYTIAAGKNLLILGADVTNAFAEAPLPKKGFFIYPNQAFLDWWVHNKKKPPLLPGTVIPIPSMMQGYPESPHLWEKHSDNLFLQYRPQANYTRAVSLLRFHQRKASSPQMAS